MIRLSTKIRYGLRTLIFLARNRDRGPVAIREIAEDQQIPRKYLESVVQLLKNSGLVRSLRGPEGGYSMARNPEDIMMNEVFEALDGPLVLVDCVEDAAVCSRASECLASRFFSILQQDMLAQLSNKTLAEVIDGK